MRDVGLWLRSLNRWERVLMAMGLVILLGWLNPFLGTTNTFCLGTVTLIVIFYSLYQANTETSYPTMPKINLYYEARAVEDFQRFQGLCRALADSALWLVESETKRTLVTLQRGWPAQVTTNVEVWYLVCRGIKLYFFPDCLILEQQGQRTALGYGALQVTFSSTWELTNPPLAADAEVVGYSWRYLKDGAPDPNYKSNPKLPMVLYGLLDLTVAPFLTLRLRVSNPRCAQAFAQGFPEPEPAIPPPHPEPEPPVRPTTSSAHEILGVAPGADLGTITSAYRRMAQLYHPDKVAGLAPEFHELAERRMKEINQAYQELKRRATR